MMEKDNFVNLKNELKDYLLGIRNYSQTYLKSLFVTLNQFMEFINVYKFNEKYDSCEEITLNDIRTLTNSDIYSFNYYLAENHYKEGSRVLKTEHLKSFFEYLFKIRHSLFRKPLNNVKTNKRTTRKLPNYLSLQEAKKLLLVYKNSTEEYEIRDNAMLHLFLNCGLRISELQNLELNNLDLKNNKFTVVGKGNKERVCYLNDITRKALDKYLEIRNSKKIENKKEAKYLFISTQSDKKIYGRTIQKNIKKAYKLADLDYNEYSVHTLRHTFATLLHKSGVDIHLIQVLLGHSEIQTTQIYTHFYNEKVMNAMLNHPLSKFMQADALAYTA